MDCNYPHGIFLTPAATPQAVNPMASPTGERRWFPLSEAEAADLEGKTPTERAAWLAHWPSTEYLARHLEAHQEPDLAERARRGEFPGRGKGSLLDRVLTDKAQFNLRARLRAGEFDLAEAAR